MHHMTQDNFSGTLFFHWVAPKGEYMIIGGDPGWNFGKQGLDGSLIRLLHA
jgi:hypothetical protein